MLGKQIQIVVFVVIVAVGIAKGFEYYAVHNVAPKSAGRQAVAPAPTKANLPVRRNEVRITADSRGQFATDAEINGARVAGMLVDTGATAVALSYEDAAAIGIFPAPADYKYSANTANGVTQMARVSLNQVRIGNLVVHDVDAFVGERGALSGSLLGMTFLSKLGRYEVDSGALVLKQ